MFIRSLFLATFFFLFLNNTIEAKMAPAQADGVLQHKDHSCYNTDHKVDCKNLSVRSYYNLNEASERAMTSPEEAAQSFFAIHGEEMGMKTQGKDLKLIFKLQTPGGVHLRYAQFNGSIPVLNGAVVVNVGKNNKVSFLMSDYKVGASEFVISKNKMSISTTALINAVIKSAGMHASKNMTVDKSKLVIAMDGSKVFAGYQILISDLKQKRGKFAGVVNAQTGEVTNLHDILVYDKAQGSAMVFEPDPTTRNNNAVIPNNDGANSPILSASRVHVVLDDITFTNGKYSLVGPYAQTFGATDFSQATPKFEFERDQVGFTAANAFYHISKALKYVNEDLGYKAKPIRYNGGVMFDPHATDDDNSFFDPSADTLSFGDGGIKDAEDMDVVLHELGHGIHSWLSDGNLSNETGLSEGCGDYWAASSRIGLGFLKPSVEQYYWVFAWDGHNEFWPGRVTNYNVDYPTGGQDEIHTAGQIWATALFRIWNQIGKRDTDKLFLETLSMLGGTANQEDAAQAFLKADQTLNGGKYHAVITASFKTAGYL